MGLSKIFRSRWSALLWAGSVIWTAYDVASANAPDPDANRTAPAATTDATGTTVNGADLDALANAMGN